MDAAPVIDVTSSVPGLRRPRPWIREVLLLTLGIKLMLMILGIVAVENRFNLPNRDRDRIFSTWNKWDSTHYFAIAEHGYGLPEASISLVFPPLLPMAVRAASWITGSIQSGGVLAATLFSLLPGLLLFKLARFDLDEDDSFRAVLVLLLCPTAFFLHLVYTESLFLALVLGAFIAARSDRWKLVALLGFLAGLTRINAFVLAPALLAEAWGSSPRGRLPRMAAALSVGVGVALYLAINYAVTGDPFAFNGIQEKNFGRTFAWPWEGAIYAIELASEGGSDSMINGMIQALCLPIFVITCGVAMWKQRASYAIWMVGNVLVITAQGYWMSLPRYLLFLFPAFIWLAPNTERPVFGALWFAGSTILLSYFAGQFAQGWWVS